ncbi:putative heat shock protein 70 family protein [Tanacetum coccineum]
MHRLHCRPIALWPYMVIDRPSYKLTVVFGHGSDEKKFTLEETCAEILRSLKEFAESYLDTTVKHAVITVTVYFSKQQRQTTKNAAALAGLDVLRLISEPTSATIAYGLDNRADIHFLKDKTVLIFNFGRQTFDVSRLNISEDGIISVKAVSSDTHEDFDKAMVNYCVQMFQQKEKKDLSNNGRAMMRLKEACENAKRFLSSTTQTCIDIDSLYEGIDFSIQFTRANFEYLNHSFFDKCIEHVESCLKDGDMHKKGVDNVILVGGSTRIPKLEQMLTEFFEGKPLSSSIMPEEVVAYGAAVLAANLSGTGKQMVQDPLLLDVAPVSLGIGLVGDIMSVVIPKNKITEKRFLNTSVLEGIPADRAGAQKLKVSFVMDANGNLNVSAVVICNGKKKFNNCQGWKSVKR